MLRRRSIFMFLGWFAVLAAAGTACAEPAPGAPAAAEPLTSVLVIPMREQIARPELFILRRGLKDAISRHAEVVVLDIKTPGGALDVTLEILEALKKFPGTTIAFVDNEAMSAGAFISAASDEIWFTPDGIIGAAAPVSALGQDVEKTMNLKITSYLEARMRAISEGKGYRGEVIAAMMDPDTELKIGEKVLKPKGKLLSLTAAEASATYGTPPQPLLAAGVAANVEALLAKKYGEHGYTVRTLEITWSERLAVMMNTISPVLLGLGLLALFIEFKTPGFGLFGITGIALLVIVFLGNFVAGLSGHEPLLVFGLGVALVAVELFFFPGLVVFAVTGLLLMFGALVWSMADLWPNEPVSVAWSANAFLAPIQRLGLGMLIAVALGVALARFIPKGWFWQQVAVAAPVLGSAQVAGGDPGTAGELAALIGRSGVAATALFPSGQVEVDGRRYEARLDVGFAPAGTVVLVKGASDFSLRVEVQT